jgi:hypothetical protein
MNFIFRQKAQDSTRNSNLDNEQVGTCSLTNIRCEVGNHTMKKKQGLTRRRKGSTGKQEEKEMEMTHTNEQLKNKSEKFYNI